MDKIIKHISLNDCRLLLRTCSISDNGFIRLSVVACLLPLFMIFTGCVKERLLEIDYDSKSTTLHLSLDIPGNSPESKAMSVANESSIDYDNIHVLVFEEVGQDEVFRYKAVITALVSQQITLKVPAGKAQERYRLVVIANANVPDIEEGTPKNEALNNFVFDCEGKWNTSDESFSLIPMWGEYKQPIVIKDNMSINILMYRALARADIGLRFKFNNPDPATGQEYPDKDKDKESVWGLNNFKIKDIRVYRTLNKAYTASSSDKIAVNEIISPNVPVSARYNSDSGTGFDDTESADNYPLVYTLSAGSDSYIREIYIPESFPLEVNSSSGNVPCIVVGGYFGENNNTHVTYYRADFASYNSNGKILNYRQLLRNHRYVFDIKNVRNAGYEEPGKALNSIVSDMILDVEEWNELPFDYHVQGNYFCSIDTREVMLDARSTGGSEISYAISYRTNLDLNPVFNPFAYKWESSGNTNNDNFDVIIDYSAKTITIKAKNDNVGLDAQQIPDQLYITVKNYQFSIDVMQKAINADYTPDCSSVVVHGVYRTDFVLNHTNYISINITSNTTLAGLNYDVYTVEENGIYFAAKGAFDTDVTHTNGIYEYSLTLKGYGTLINESGGASFNIMVIFNSITPATCSVEIQVDI